jgi:outer membrane protein OmpA-like peptidoglycan-associated protein
MRSRSIHPLFRVLATAAAISFWLASPVQAQTFEFPSVNLRPAASPLNYYVTENGTTLPHLSPSVAMLLNYSHLPLVLYDRIDGELVRAVVNYQVNMDLMMALGLWDRLEIGVAIPLTLVQDDEQIGTLRGVPGGSLSGGIGDIRLILKARIWTVGPFTVGATAPVSFPTGSGENLLSNGGVTFAPRLVLALNFDRAGGAINAGYRLRNNQSFTLPMSDVQGKISVGDQFFASAGGRVGLWKDRMDLIADVFMSLEIDEQDAEEVCLELLGGLRFYLPYGLTANIGGGPGLTRGLGTPSFRILGGVTYQYKKEQPPLPPQERDSDGDGILDGADKCPDKPEDRDDFEDQDGCPDLDNDRDKIPDTDDRCPNKPEDLDGFEDADGCPDPDNDGDTVLDLNDRCPDEPEDLDRFQDSDGCPDPDNDGDRILDADDKCPNKPEIYNKVDDHDGCPDAGKGPVRVTYKKIKVPPVFFATNSDVILKRSHRTLKHVARTLMANPWIKKLRIEGHTDNRGNDQFNMELSRRRAKSVREYLVGAGVNTRRLVSQGYGETAPKASNRTRRGRAKNRRVEFVIVDPRRKQR